MISLNIMLFVTDGQQIYPCLELKAAQLDFKLFATWLQDFIR